MFVSALGTYRILPGKMNFSEVRYHALSLSHTPLEPLSQLSLVTHGHWNWVQLLFSALAPEAGHMQKALVKMKLIYFTKSIPKFSESD